LAKHRNDSSPSSGEALGLPPLLPSLLPLLSLRPMFPEPLLPALALMLPLALLLVVPA
jgi:hypothetical protein